MSETALIRTFYDDKNGDKALPIYDRDMSELLRLIKDMLVYGAPNIKETIN